MRNVIKISILVATLALVACAPEDPKLKNTLEPVPTPAPVIPPAPDYFTDRAKVSNQYESPKIDILFVMDNSNSMRAHQENLIRNIDKFAKSFIDNTDVDFQIGVVKVFDSIRFKDQVPNGQLLNGFVTRSADTVSDLKRILNVGVQPLNNENPAAGGPEFEELFSPIVSFFSEENQKGPNAGFYRPEAHLAIILVSDANDATPNFDETNLDAFLFRLKNKKADKYSVHGVISFGLDKNRKKCPVDPSEYPARVENLISLTKGTKLSLCDKDFGAKLGQVGSDIAAKAVFKRVVELSYIPDEKGTFVVKCEGEVVPANQVNYDRRSLRVTLDQKYPKCRDDRAEIEVTYVKLTSDQLQVNH